MSLALAIVRAVRRATWQAGLASDRTRGVAVHVDRLLDGLGQTLFERTNAPGLVAVVRLADGRRIVRSFPRPGFTVFDENSVALTLSVSKPVTAMVALALVERGALALDEPIWRRMRSFRLPLHAAAGFNPDDVTLRGVLCHASGFGPLWYGWVRDDAPPVPASTLLREASDTGALRIENAPWKSIRYAAGIFLLAEILIEDVTGRAFSDVAREMVLRPLGMDSSDFDRTSTIAARIATSYDAENRPYPVRSILATAASGLYSTATDLTTFWASLVQGAGGEPPGRGVISPAMAREMVTPQIRGDDGAACGLGFFLREKRAATRYSHLGYFDGWHLQVEGMQRPNCGVTVLGNGDRAKDCVAELARALRRKLFHRAF